MKDSGFQVKLLVMHVRGTSMSAICSHQPTSFAHVKHPHTDDDRSDPAFEAKIEGEQILRRGSLR